MYSLQEFIVRITLFISNTLLPFLFGLALLFFLYNAFQLFILKSGEKDGQESAKRFALYSIAAFVFLVSLWGIVNLLVNGLWLNEEYPVEPDYKVQTGGGGVGGGGSGLGGGSNGVGGGGSEGVFSEPFRGPR